MLNIPRVAQYTAFLVQGSDHFEVWLNIMKQMLVFIATILFVLFLKETPFYIIIYVSLFTYNVYYKCLRYF